MKGVERFRFIYNVILVIVFFGSSLLFPVISFAQTLSPDCDDTDPVHTQCPLDTWVIGLAFIAIIFAARHLYRKQRQSAPNFQG
jgi:preprotein translocase subunit SecG